MSGPEVQQPTSGGGECVNLAVCPGERLPAYGDAGVPPACARV